MDTKQKIDEILSETGKAVLGKQEVLSRILTAILAGGHILIDDIPGVGKTTIAVAFTHALGLDYKRMRFTPDFLRISRAFPCTTRIPASSATCRAAP